MVAVPGYNVDRYGRILGKGHAVRDIVEWSIPLLWPIDLINLPRRGPRPTLKEETRLTLKIMDDLGVPEREPYQREPYQEESPGLLRRPSAYRPSESQPAQPAPQPVAQTYTQPAYQQPVVQTYAQPVYQQPVVQMYVQPVYLPAPPVYYYPSPPPVYYAPQVMVRAANPYYYSPY